MYVPACSPVIVIVPDSPAAMSVFFALTIDPIRPLLCGPSSQISTQVPVPAYCVHSAVICCVPPVASKSAGAAGAGSVGASLIGVHLFSISLAFILTYQFSPVIRFGVFVQSVSWCASA